MNFYLFFSALLLITCPAFAQTLKSSQNWPRNQQTGKIEFHGVLAWPTWVETEHQRQTLVRKWYTAKLIDDPPEQELKEADEETFEGFLTYGHLLNDVVIQYGKGPQCAFLVYSVYLTPSPLGVEYVLTKFSWNTCDGIHMKKPNKPLEHVLAQDSSINAAALNFFRPRFNKLTGW